MDNKELEFREYADKKIKELQLELTKWEVISKALKNKNGVDTNLFEIETTNVQSQNVEIGSKLTFQEKIINILKKENVPLTSRDLMNLIIQYYPPKKYTIATFSGIFSPMYSKKNSGIRKYEVKNFTKELRALYGLKEWFEENGDFKEEYQNKILEKYGRI